MNSQTIKIINPVKKDYKPRRRRSHTTPVNKEPRYPSATKAVKIAYDPEVVFQLLSTLYHDADKDILRQYVNFCFSSNLCSYGFVSKKPHHQNKDHRYHHILPKCLVPSMANSLTNLIQLTRKDHFEAHCLLALAFRSYYHSPDSKKSHIFCYLSLAVGACLGQLSHRIQDANRTWYADQFFQLTGKHIAGSDKLEQFRDYQSIIRSTPRGKAYDNLKGYLRYLTLKYKINFPASLSGGVPARTDWLLQRSNLCLSSDEVQHLTSLLKKFESVQHALCPRD